MESAVGAALAEITSLVLLLVLVGGALAVSVGRDNDD